MGAATATLWALCAGCGGDNSYSKTDRPPGCQQDSDCGQGNQCIDRICVQPCPEEAKSAPEPAPADDPAPKDAPAPDAPVKLGVDVLLDERIDLLKGKRVGLITNASAVDGKLNLTVDRFIDDKRVNLTQLYSPEHGLTGEMRNGQSDSDKDANYRYGGQSIPVQGLTGKHFRPSKETMKRIDVLVFDIQDIGSRTYTYISTLGLAMEAAQVGRIPIIVLDRPNPLGGTLFEGPVRLRKHKTFIGWGPLPVSHGMTVGEIAHFYRNELGIKCDLEVVKMKHWRRDMVWQDTGLTWVPTSPGIPHPHNAQLYVTTGMVGGSGPNVNEGGGNSMPFELIGALFIGDPKRLARHLNDAALPGVFFRPLIYKPWGRQFTDKRVAGVHLMLTDPSAHRPLRTALTILVTLQKLYGGKMTVKNPKRFARVWGNEWVLKMIREGKSVAEIEARWQPELDDFAKKRSKALIYPAP